MGALAAQSGRCHAPISSRRRSSGGGGRHNPCQSVQPDDKRHSGQPTTSPRTYRPGRTPPALDAEPDTESDTLELTYGAASATAPEREQQCAKSTTVLSTGRIAPQTRTSCLRT